jgi:hypothetical protein
VNRLGLSPRFSLVAFVGLAAGAGAALAACAPDDDQDPDAAPGPLALYRGIPNGDDAGLEGVLVLLDGCLYVCTDLGDDFLLALPVSDASWDPDDGALRADGRRYRPGDTVRFGGGESKGRPDLDWSVPPDDQCDASLMWIGRAHE